MIGPQGLFDGFDKTPVNPGRPTLSGPETNLALNQTQVSYMPSGGVKCEAFVSEINDQVLHGLIEVWAKDLVKNAGKHIKVTPSGQGFIIKL